jgi:hypothetical protein
MVRESEEREEEGRLMEGEGERERRGEGREERGRAG